MESGHSPRPNKMRTGPGIQVGKRESWAHTKTPPKFGEITGAPPKNTKSNQQSNLTNTGTYRMVTKGDHQPIRRAEADNNRHYTRGEALLPGHAPAPVVGIFKYEIQNQSALRAYRTQNPAKEPSNSIEQLAKT